MVKFGLIGCGNMGGALAKAASQALPKEELLLANRTPAKAQALAEKLGGCAVGENTDVAAQAQYIFLGVKPQMMADMLVGIAPVLAQRTEKGERFVLVSMAAGLTCAQLRQLSGGEYPVLRIMPNTPSAIGKGMTTYCAKDVTAEEIDTFLQMMAAAGRFDALEERLMDAASAVAGCSPAFVYQFIEALADGGVECGLPRAKALQYAAAAVEGAAALVLESGKHPGALKDEVCSPGGSTIAGVHALERGGLRAAVMDAVTAAAARGRQLGEEAAK